MPLFRVQETVTTYSPWGFPIPHSDTVRYRGNDRQAAEAVYFERYEALELPNPPEKTAQGGLSGGHTKDIFFTYWLTLIVEDESPAHEGA